ncbi:gliding motility-associated C-terminal domain-containing protein [Marinilongibacter aquaticus]|uniref:T9SS type B sorting domain-containing protein n=1 Tax=Marinilongibacter aquaticus TaxID=2975157 RepID=UPI0021BD3A9B|nr:gliding motility-associated C-terminal domain-containing protein [Marinilongibacter aquaticus]UBM57625.1 gliding motility-associated C-terminal domain-containing protein [Marinilongibacter aquaticus]
MSKVSIFLCVLVLLSLGAKQTRAQIYAGKACATEAGGAAGGTGGTSSTSCPQPVYFFDEDPDNKDWTWDFADGQSENPDVRNPQVYFNSPGPRTITLTRADGSTESKSINVGSGPNQPMFNKSTEADTTVCEGSSLTLDPFKGLSSCSNCDYLWFPGGENTPTIDVDVSGCYSVEVFDQTSRCSKTAKINVKFCYKPGSAGGGSGEDWYFGHGAGLTFDVTTIPAKRDYLDENGEIFNNVDRDSLTNSPIQGSSNKMNTDAATAMVYGPNGLAFYTDGKAIYNGNDDEIQYSAGVTPIPDSEASQLLAIVPKNDCVECPHHQYYVFSKDPSNGLVSYSIIDLRYNAPTGEIIKTGIPVAFNVTDKMSVIQTNDGLSYDIYLHNDYDSGFTRMSLDSTGLNATNMSTGMGLDEPADASGYMATNLEGTMMAQGVVIGGENYLDVYLRDPDTGELQGILTVDLGFAAPPEVYGVAFSESSNYVYVTLSGTGQTSHLLQVPIYLGTGAAVEAGIEEIESSTNKRFGALQLGPIGPNSSPNKYMYMAVEGATKLPYIQEPDQDAGAGVNAVSFTGLSNGVNVGGTIGLGLPTIVFDNSDSDGDGVSAQYTGNCFNATTNLNLNELCSPMRNEVEWSFEDGSSMKGTNVNYTFPHTGWNPVKVTVRVFNKSALSKIVNSQILQKIVEQTESACTEVSFEDSVYIKPAPQIAMPDTVYNCIRGGIVTPAPVEPVVTGEGAPFTYLWTTIFDVPVANSGDPILVTPVLSTYKLKVTNSFSCETTDTVSVKPGCLPEVEFPTAFTPQGANPDFEFYNKYLYKPILRIYNRWGEIIYEWRGGDDTAPLQYWNGKTSKGTFVPTGLYPYQLTYYAKDFPWWGKQKKSGAVWVLY